MYNYYVTNASGSWISNIVDHPLWVNADIAMDSSDSVHVSYLGFPGVTHAIYTSGSWSTEVPDRKARCDASLAIDAANKVHIIYYAYTTQPASSKELRYATNASGAWKVSIVDTSTNYGCYVGDGKSLALSIDANGFAHIAYLGDYPQYGLKYATNKTGSWNSSIITLSYSKSPSISVDVTETIHVVYSTTPLSKHASFTKGLWTIKVIESKEWSQFHSFALDAAGNKFVNYIVGNNLWGGQGELRYMTAMYGGWSTSVVDYNVCAANTDMSLDSLGRVHISYFGSQSCSLKYAINK